MLDSKLSFGPHISQLVSRCFLQLRRIKSCVQALSMDVRKTVVNSFVISRVDDCNSLEAAIRPAVQSGLYYAADDPSFSQHWSQTWTTTTYLQTFGTIVILRISPHHSHHLRSHHLSLPWPFTPDLTLISFTNPFLHSHSYSFRTDFTVLNLYCIKGHWRCFFSGYVC